MSWDELANEGNETVKIIRLGLNKRGLITGDSCKTVYGTDEYIPIFNTFINPDLTILSEVKVLYSPLSINGVDYHFCFLISKNLRF
jgi:hypothetical protein